MSGWQPMSTAPRDGERILAVDSRDGAVEMIRWCDRWYGKEDGHWNFAELDEEYGERMDDSTFTHWMPLPTPPGE